MVKLSVIITAYQAERTIGRAINSVLNTSDKNEIEIVVVDDCSSDNTCNIVRELQKCNSNIRLFSMPENTGSPSEPRNFGVRKAEGEYITFLDDDDEFVVSNLLAMVYQAEVEQADFVKGYLLCEENGKFYEANRLPEVPNDKTNTIRQLIAVQSMTQDFIVKRSVLIDHNLNYRKELKIGEDTIFILSILSVVQKPLYIDNYYLIYHKTPLDIVNRSSTQNCGDREIINQIASWKMAEEIAEKMNLSYYKLRLAAGFRNLLLSIVRYSDGISEEAYQILYEFAVFTKKYISATINLNSRYSELYKAILSGDYKTYRNVSKRRMVIAGYDLKFILPVVPYLEGEYEIKIDEWSGHNSHDREKSRKLAEWADIIWCEWLLGNAVFYSKLKNKHQRLVIRAHRFELDREFGDMLDYNNVDAIFMVGYYYYEKFIERFSIPRRKARLLSNYVEDSIYSTQKSPDSRYHIGLVGILPSRKGFLRGLELLSILIEKDPKYKLHVMGKRPDEVDWIRDNPTEKAYFSKCSSYIKTHNLEDKVVYEGFKEREQLYNNVGFVLSLSDNEKPESFHLAPAEAACAGTVGYLLAWPGVEYIYPSDVICSDIDEMAIRIMEANSGQAIYEREVASLKKYIISNYSMDRFLSVLKKYLVDIRITG